MSSSSTVLRKIIHVDMDAFFAAVEQLDRPELRGKPIIVGGDPGKRGVVATCSYEARRFGIHSAMSSARAHSICPQAIFIRPRFERYRDVSREIRKIFNEVSEIVEPASLDEAYLDVTQNRLGEPLAKNVAIHVKHRIREETGLTASAGAGPNKFIAKVASDLRKPDGLVVVHPSRVLSFIGDLPIERLWGVGPARARQLHRLGFELIKDLRDSPIAWLEKKLGSFGPYLHDLSHGIDHRPVVTHHELKSRSSETTFDKDLVDLARLKTVLRTQAEEVFTALQKHQKSGRTATLKVRYDDFITITRSQTYPFTIENSESLYQAGCRLLERTEAGRRPVRLLGIGISGFETETVPYQLPLLR